MKQIKTKVTNPKTRRKIQKIIEHHENFRNSYFFNSPSHAYARRAYEKSNSKTTTFRFNGDFIEVVQNVSCSCSYVYYKMTIYINDKVTNKDLRYLKKLLKGEKVKKKNKTKRKKTKLKKQQVQTYTSNNPETEKKNF